MKRSRQTFLVKLFLSFLLLSGSIYAVENQNKSECVIFSDSILPVKHADVISIDGWVEYERYYHQWNGADWANGVRLLYEYDKNANCVLLTYQDYKYDSYYEYYYYSTEGRTVYTYNTSNNLITVLDQDYYYGEWKNDKKWEYTYNSSGNPITYTCQYWRNDAWNNYWRYLYTYNTKKLLTEEIYQNWDTNSWENYYCNTYTYNASNYKLSMIHQLWDNSSWENDSKEEYSYYSGYLKQKVDYYWYSGTWINHAKNLYSYDSKGNLKEDLIQWLTTDWNDAKRYQYSYNTGNKMTEKLYQTVEDGDWLNNYRFKYDYDSNGNRSEEVYQTWETSTWLNVFKWLYYCREFSVPSISSVSLFPEAPTDQDNLTISATVEDKSEELVVECVYSFANNTTISPMVLLSSNSYSLDISALGENGIFQYYIRVKNNIGLKDSSSLRSVNISNYIEPTPPEISSIAFSPSDPSENDTIKIDAIITDNFGLSKVECIYRFNDTQYTQNMMDGDEGSDSCHFEILPFGQSGNLDFYIRAENTQGLKDSSEISTITIVAGTSDIVQFASKYDLFNVYPNPFNPTTTIAYELYTTSTTRIDLFDIEGKHIQCLIDEQQDAGHYELEINGSKLSSGVYLISFKSDHDLMCKKILLLK